MFGFGDAIKYAIILAIISLIAGGVGVYSKMLITYGENKCENRHQITHIEAQTNINTIADESITEMIKRDKENAKILNFAENRTEITYENKDLNDEADNKQHAQNIINILNAIQNAQQSNQLHKLSLKQND